MFSGPAIGLYDSPNPFSKTPAGTLKRADNVRFTAPGVLSPRRGFFDLVTFGTSTSLADSMAFYGQEILLAYDLTKVSLYTSGAFTDFSGTFLPVGDNRMRFEGAARSVFFNTMVHGLYAWDGTGVSGEPVEAGNALGVTATAKPDGDNGWQPSNSAVAYRYTICFKDAYQRIVEGPPSGRTIVINKMTVPNGVGWSRTSNVVTVNYNIGLGTAGLYNLHVGNIINIQPGAVGFAAGLKTLTSVDNVNGVFTYAEAGADGLAPSVTQTLTITTSGLVSIALTAGSKTLVGTNNFIRLYRSEATLTATDTPSDEMFLAYESPFITSADLVAGYLVINDTAPESVLDVPLYTNQNTGDGALAARYRPPRSLDLVYWASRMWYANTSNLPSIAFELIGTGSPDGLQLGDKFIIADSEGSPLQTYTAASVASGTDFALFTGGDPGFDIENTARSLCAQINANASNDECAAYYVSSEGGLPGSILLVGLNYDVAYSLYSDRETSWTPQLPDPMTPLWPAPQSDDNAHPAGLYWSSIGIPDGVPPTNNLLVNSDNDEILRIFPLHYRLIIFKTDGIYSCTNVEPFNIQKISAYRLLAPDSVAVLEDALYALTDQGIIIVTDAGVEDISNPIDNTLNALQGSDDDATRTFGFANRQERQYMMWTIERDSDSPTADYTDDNAQAFIYSTLSGGYTRYPFGARCAAIGPVEDVGSGVLVYAKTDSNTLRAEVNNHSAFDFYDGLLNATITAISGSNITVSSATGIQVGDLIQRSSRRYLISAISGNVLTVVGTPTVTTGSAVILIAIPCAVEFNKLTGGEPATMKMSQQASLLFRQNTIRNTELEFHSEIQTVDQEVTKTSVGWGEFEYGVQPWGSLCEQILRVEPLPLGVANCCQLSVGFETRQALAFFEFLGLDVVESEDTSANRGA